MPATLQQVVEIKEQLRQFSQEQLLEVNQFINNLYRTQRTNKNYAQARELAIGDKVVTSGIKPTRYNGLTVKVTDIRQTRVSIELDDRSMALLPHGSPRVIRVPAACVKTY